MERRGKAGEEQDGEGRGARGDWAGSEEPMDADGQGIKGLWGWVDERFWGGAGEGGVVVGLLSDYFVNSNLGHRQKITIDLPGVKTLALGIWMFREKRLGVDVRDFGDDGWAICKIACQTLVAVWS